MATGNSWSFGSFLVLSGEGSGATRATPPELEPRFEVLGLLGEGGMGVVYRAHDRALGRDVALKVVRGERAGGKRHERFLRECELAASLHHSHIVRVHAAGEVDGQPFMVSELIEGAKTLDQAMPTMDRRQRLEVIRDVARALGYAHSHGVVHRDVKPANVLVDPAGRVKLTDFGLATTPGVTRLTQTGALVGTPRYMAPEQLTADRALQGPPTDVWGLGVLLYQALTERLPFDAEGMLELSARIMEGAPKLRTQDPTIPRALEVICLRALEVQPEDRYPDGTAVAADLDDFLQGNSRAGLSAPRRYLWAASLVAVAGVVLGGLALMSAEPTPTPDQPRQPPSAAPEPELGAGIPEVDPDLQPPQLPPEAEELSDELRRRVRRNPDDLNARAFLALKLVPTKWVIGDPPIPETDLEQEVSEHVEWVLAASDASPAARAAALQARSFMSARRRDYRGASADIAEVVKLQRGNARAWHQFVLLSAVQGYLRPAGLAATHALRLGGLTARKKADLYGIRALARETRGDLAGAVRDTDEAIRLLAPGHPLRENKIKRLAKLRRALATPKPEPTPRPKPVGYPLIPELRMRLAADPTDLDARAFLALRLVNLGPAEESAAREASRHVRAVLGSKQASPSARSAALLARGEMRRDLGDRPGWLEDTKAATKAQARNQNAWAELAKAAVSNGEWAIGRDAADRALRIRGLPPQTTGHTYGARGLAREQLQDTVGAIRDYQAAAKLLPPGDPLRINTDKRLAKILARIPPG